MSYKTYNVIIKINEESEVENLKTSLREVFKFYNIREFFTPFKGMVCQAGESFKHYPFEKFPDNFFKNQDEVEDYFSDAENNVIKFSKEQPNLEVAYIEVDCYGGQCTSNGFIVKNGEKILNQDVFHSGHMKILNALDEQYNSWHFYPFTRSFFTDKGGVNGEILNFSFPAIWMAFNMEVENNPNFEINAAENELQVIDQNKFEIYLMNLGRERIKVLGRLFKNDTETINELKELICEALEGVEFYIEIDGFENGEKTVVSSISKQIFAKVAQMSYRETAFNERKFVLPSENNRDEKKEGLLGRLFKSIFGK